MRGIYNANLSASRKKIKKTHSKAKLASGLYTLGALALMVLVFCTTLNVKFAENGLSITTFFRPLIDIFKGDLNLIAVVIMLLYLFMVIFAVVNFFKCFSKFGRILRRSYKNITTCNKNMLLMEEAGDAFSASFVCYAVVSFIITILSYAKTDTTGQVLQMPFTMMGLIALAVGLVIHFVAGTIGGTVSIFIVGATVEEKQREDKIAIFLVRNVMQVLVLAAIWYFFVPASNLYYQLDLLLQKSPDCILTNPGNDMLAFSGLILQPVACVWLIVLMKHALSSTEYNLSGMYGPGMHVFRVFSVFTAVTAIGLFILDVFNGKKISNYLFVAILSVVGFVLDLVIAPHEPREPKAVETEPEEEEVKDEPKLETKPQPAPVSAPAYGCPIRPCAQAPAAMPPQQRETVCSNEPDYDEYVLTKNGEMPPRPVVGLPIGMPPAAYPREPEVAPTRWKVTCPTCGKELWVKDATKLSRCPSCGNIFGVKVGKLVSPDAEASEKAPESSETATEKPSKKNKKDKKQKD